MYFLCTCCCTAAPQNVSGTGMWPCEFSRHHISVWVALQISMPRKGVEGCVPLRNSVNTTKAFLSLDYQLPQATFSGLHRRRRGESSPCCTDIEGVGVAPQIISHEHVQYSADMLADMLTMDRGAFQRFPSSMLVEALNLVIWMSVEHSRDFHHPCNWKL